jgi:hypothetical protein
MAKVQAKENAKQKKLAAEIALAEARARSARLQAEYNSLRERIVKGGA